MLKIGDIVVLKNNQGPSMVVINVEDKNGYHVKYWSLSKEEFIQDFFPLDALKLVDSKKSEVKESKNSTDDFLFLL